MDECTTLVDITIPSYHPDEQFYAMIKKLLHQTVRVKEFMQAGDTACLNKIRIVNTEKEYFDSKRLESIRQEFPNCIEVQHITREQFDHGGTRNAAAAQSEADILVFMTQDAMPEDSYLLEKLIEPIQNGQAVVSYGRQLANAKANEIEKYTRQFNYPSQSYMKGKEDLQRLGIKTYFCSNVCSAYRRDVYIKLGGFVTQTIFNEDMIFASKVIQNGYKIAYTAEARVIHSHKYTYHQQFTRNFDLGVSQRQYREIFESIKSESEGMALVKKTCVHLLKTGKWYLIPDLIIQSAYKFLGYKCGLRYEKLSNRMRRKLSMNKSYWDKASEK